VASGAHYHYETMRTARLFLAAAVLVVFLAVALVPVLVRLNGYGLAASLVLIVGGLWLSFVAFQHAPDTGLAFERDTRRKFRAVCREKHLAKMDIKNGRLFYPQLSELIGGGDSWRVTIRPLLGQSLADWQKAGDSFAMAYGVVNVRFVDIGGGRISMTAGYRPMAAREFVPVAHRQDDEATGWRARLATVPVGITEGGGTYCLPLLESHTLIAGITGAGKGSVIWSAILGLAPAIRAGVVKVWGFDPKQMELSIGRGVFGDRYASDPEDMVELLEQAHAEMQKRAAELAGHVRRFEPSEQHPFNVLVIDELGYLSALLPDRKLRQRADDALSGILVLGRAVGYSVIGALQDPRKETLSYRDLFPTRVAMKLTKPMVDLVLGTGMHEAGALCDLIPDRRAGGAGVAFVLGEGSGAPLCVRMTWCSDELISTIAGTLGDGGASPLPIGA
jgi:DNA segregation ATPase FtsK/SpoIIIE, S-DNA-T family